MSARPAAPTPSLNRASPLRTAGRGLRLMTHYADVGLALGVIGLMFVLVVPLPTWLLDVLLCCQFGLSLAVLLGTLYCAEPLEFSGFPPLLLFVTLFRVSLNVASSRLILMQADAGHVIESFGQFVVGGNYVIGAVIFLIFIIIQFVVITKGAGRVAEVAARFTLDAMPGKQMAIDADLNAGLIDEAQARDRRRKIEREANFYGAMDGASKFVRGDAIAALVITLVNIVGGLVVGVLMQGRDLSGAARTYSLLTIGDGLVTQIPALLVSTAAGILVTRSASEFSLGRDLSAQLLGRPKTLAMTAVFMGVFMMVPGMPKLVFGTLMVLTALLAWTMRRAGPALAAAAAAAGAGAGTPGIPGAPTGPGTPSGTPGAAAGAAGRDGRPQGAPAEIEELLKVEPLELELGASLIPLVEPGAGGDLLSRIAQIRKRMASETGIILPPVRVRDNLQLPPRHYRLLLRGASVGEGELQLDGLLAINPGGARSGLEGTPTVDPAFGLPGLWVAPAQRGRAEAYGYTVVEPPAVLSTHLHELLRANAAELLSRQDVQDMVDRVRESAPAVVKDVVPNAVSLSVLHRVLQGLLRERVPVRDLTIILETLGDHAGQGKTPEMLVEAARAALAPQFVRGYADAQGRLAAVALDPGLESRMAQAVAQTEEGPALVLPPLQVPRIIQAIEEHYARAERRRRNIVLICSAALRPHLRRLLERSLPKLPVISYMEIPRGLQLEIVSQVSASVWAVAPGTGGGEGLPTGEATTLHTAPGRGEAAVGSSSAAAGGSTAAAASGAAAAGRTG